MLSPALYRELNASIRRGAFTSGGRCVWLAWLQFQAVSCLEQAREAAA